MSQNYIDEFIEFPKMFPPDYQIPKVRGRGNRMLPIMTPKEFRVGFKLLEKLGEWLHCKQCTPEEETLM